MTRHVRLLLLAVTATLVSAVGTASALGYELTFTSLGAITFGSEVKCAMTLQTDFVEWTDLPIETRAAGTVDAAQSEECEGADEVIALGLPWTIGNIRVLGTLPNLTGILVTIQSMAIELRQVFGGLDCLYSGNVGMLLPIVRLGSGEYTWGLAALLGNSINRAAGQSIFCPSTIPPAGEFTPSPLIPITIL